MINQFDNKRRLATRSGGPVSSGSVCKYLVRLDSDATTNGVEYQRNPFQGESIANFGEVWSNCLDYYTFDHIQAIAFQFAFSVAVAGDNLDLLSLTNLNNAFVSPILYQHLIMCVDDTRTSYTMFNFYGPKLSLRWKTNSSSNLVETPSGEATLQFMANLQTLVMSKQSEAMGETDYDAEQASAWIHSLRSSPLTQSCVGLQALFLEDVWTTINISRGSIGTKGESLYKDDQQLLAKAWSWDGLSNKTTLKKNLFNQVRPLFEHLYPPSAPIIDKFGLTYSTDNVILANSLINNAGLGVFATKPIKKNQVISHYAGEVANKDICRVLPQPFTTHIKTIFKGKGGDNLVGIQEPYPYCGVGSFVNSDNPANAKYLTSNDHKYVQMLGTYKPRGQVLSGANVVLIVAIRDIEMWEEITINYVYVA